MSSTQPGAGVQEAEIVARGAPQANPDVAAGG